MKHYKKMMLLIYGALLLICIGIVWLLGALNRQGNTGDGRESAAQEGSQQSGENPNGGRTPGTENRPDVAGNGLDESEESEEERLARLEQERQEWLAERMDQIKIKRRQRNLTSPRP